MLFSKSNSALNFQRLTKLTIGFLSYKVNIKLDLSNIASSRAVSIMRLWKSCFPSFKYPLSLKFSSDFETSFTVNSYTNISTNLGDRESAFALSGNNTAEPPYPSLAKNCRPPTPDPYHHLLIFDNQKINQAMQHARYHILLVNRKNKILQSSTNNANWQFNRLIQTTTELKFEVPVKFVGLDRHPLPTSTQIKHQIFLSRSVVTSLHFTATEEPPFDLQSGCITFHNPISCLKYKTIFWGLWFYSLWDLWSYSL